MMIKSITTQLAEQFSHRNELKQHFHENLKEFDYDEY